MAQPEISIGSSTSPISSTAPFLYPRAPLSQGVTKTETEKGSWEKHLRPGVRLPRTNRAWRQKKLMGMGFDPVIVDYICRRLRDGIADSTITDELMRTDDPLFSPINSDFGVAISYLAYAKKVRTKGKA